MAAAQVQLQPDIQYHPDYSKFLDRSKRRLERETLTKVIPPGLPQRLSSPFVWDGNEIQGRDDWVIALTDNHLEEVDRALSHFKGRIYTPAPHSPRMDSLEGSLDANKVPIRIEQIRWVH